MFNISLDKSASNQHCSPEDPGPKYLFYKLGLEGKKLNVKTKGVEDLKILACLVRFRWFKETGFLFVCITNFATNDLKNCRVIQIHMNYQFLCRQCGVSKLHNSWSTSYPHVTIWYGSQHPVNNRFQET